MFDVINEGNLRSRYRDDDYYQFEPEQSSLDDSMAAQSVVVEGYRHDEID